MEKKAKILVIPSWYPQKDKNYGGIQFQEQSELFLQLYDVRVLFGSITNLSNKQWLFKYRRQKANLLDITTTSSGLKEYRFEFHSWFTDDRHILGYQIEAYKEIIKKMISDGWKPDMIHARCVSPAGIISCRLAYDLRIPWILSEHQNFDIGNHPRYYIKLIKQAINSADKFTVVSQHQLRSISSHYIFRDMLVTGNLIDEKHFPICEKNSIKSPFKILAVMFPHPIKGPDTFFKTIKHLKNNGHDDIMATVIGKKIGSKADISDFQNLAEKYQVMDKCRFIPYVSREQMPNFFAESNVIVSTSVVETFGIAVREAMMVGKPVVCTASGGVDDDIFDFNGFKVNIYDYEAVAAAIISIKTGIVNYDPKIIRQYVIKKYGRQAYLERFSRIYDDALQMKSSAI